jgi:hypothetical protein
MQLGADPLGSRLELGGLATVLFMVIEHFKDAEAVTAVYQRFREKGRMMARQSRLYRQLDRVQLRPLFPSCGV